MVRTNQRRLLAGKQRQSVRALIIMFVLVIPPKTYLSSSVMALASGDGGRGARTRGCNDEIQGKHLQSAMTTVDEDRSSAHWVDEVMETGFDILLDTIEGCCGDGELVREMEIRRREHKGLSADDACGTLLHTNRPAQGGISRFKFECMYIKIQCKD